MFLFVHKNLWRGFVNVPNALWVCVYVCVCLFPVSLLHTLECACVKLLSVHLCVCRGTCVTLCVLGGISHLTPRMLGYIYLCGVTTCDSKV